MEVSNSLMDLESDTKPEQKRLMPLTPPITATGVQLEFTPINPVTPDECNVASDACEAEECKICGDALASENRVTFTRCDHLYCSLCFSDYLSYKLSLKSVELLHCPAFNCPVIISEEEMKPHMSKTDFEKLKRFRYEIEVEKIPNMRWCPQLECRGYDTGGIEKRRLMCSVCHYEYCFYCLEAWHNSGKCKGEADRKLDRWAKSHNAKFCPSCHMKIEKQQGCNHMTCITCKYQFCWLCGAQFSVAHINACPVTRLRKKNPPWYFCLLLLLMPVVMPLLFIFIMFRGRQKYLEDEIDGCFTSFLKTRWISFPLIVLVGAILTPLAITCFFLFTLGAVFIRRGLYYQYDSSSCFQCLAQKRCLWNWLSVLLGMLLSPLVVLAVVAVAVCAPMIGLALFLFKLFILMIRCCSPEFMRATGVRGYRVG